LNVAAWLPKPVSAIGSATVLVRTQRDALLSGDGWSIDPAPMRGVLAADTRRREAILTNLRLERRSGRRRREGLEAALRELSSRSRRRLQDACHQYASHVLSYALSRNARTVLYDDADRSALTHFPWHDLRRRVSEKLAVRNIGFVHVSGDADSKPAAPAPGEREHAA
jgi:hypothetical protein